MMPQKKDRSLFSEIPIDKNHKIESFDMIGMTDPVNSKIEKTIKWLRSLDIETKVYPEASYDPND